VQRLVKIQSRQSKQKLEDVKLLANENDEGNEIDDAETTKKSKKRRKIGNSGLNEDDLLEYDMNMLLDRDDPRRGADENLDTMSNMSEFNAAPSGSRAVSGGNNQFYLRDEEVLQWAKNAGDSDNNDVVVSKHKSNKRLQLEKSRKAKLDLDDEDMMFRFGYGGHIDDDDLSGDEEARERKRQRALCMENNNDDDDQILMPIPDEGSEDEDQQGFVAIPMNDSEEEKAFLEPAFQSQKEQEQREERFHFGLRETNALVRPRQKRPKVARLANQRAIIFDQQTRIENNEYKSWLKNCDDILCDRPRKEIPIDEMDIHLMNDEKALASHFRATAFQTGRESFFRKGNRWKKFEAMLYPNYKSKVNFAPIPGDATLVPPPEVKQQRPDGEYTTEDEDNAYNVPPAWDDDEEENFLKFNAIKRAENRTALVRTPSSGGGVSASLRSTRGGSVVRTPSSLADALEGKELEFVDDHGQPQGNLQEDIIHEDRAIFVHSFSQKSNEPLNKSQPLRETEEDPAGYLDCSGRARHESIPRAAKNLLVFLSSNTVWNQDDTNTSEAAFDDISKEIEEKSSASIDLTELCESNALTRQAAARCFYNVLILQSEAFVDADQNHVIDEEDDTRSALDDIPSVVLRKGDRYREGLAASLAT
tara:strand:- start:2141 stop:4081 length:1941 start_codon:yes stop_codon:yes gene_type:complete